MKLFLLFFSFGTISLFSSGIFQEDSSKIGADSSKILLGGSNREKFRVDSLVASTDSLALDSLEMADVRDTIIPLTFSPLSLNSIIIPQEEIRRTNLRFAGDLFSSTPISFKRSLGMSGLAEEMNFYGAGFGNVSYFENGILLNDRIRNVYDLNLYQTEDVDSIELVPSPRGFLHGTFSNLASVNFITKDFVAMPPYTRIKYIESPLGEGYVDAQFNSLFSKKYLFGFDISNRKVDNGFANSDYSIWQTKVKLKYFYSNDLNVIFSYGFVKSDVGLNGGLNVDSTGIFLWNLGAEKNAPVVFNYRYQKVKQHNFMLRTLAHVSENSTSELSFYYRFNLDEYRQNEFNTSSAYPQFFSNRKTKVLGWSADHKTIINAFNLDVNATYEAVDYFEPYQFLEIKKDALALRGVASLQTEHSVVIPSIFAKTVLTKDENFSGVGGDLQFHPTEKASLYLGFSVFEKVTNKTTAAGVYVFEAGIKRESEASTEALTLFYNRSNTGNTAITVPFASPPNISYVIQPTGEEENYGAALTFNTHYWKIYGLTSTTVLKKKFGTGNEAYLPNLTFDWKVEYRDTLFNSSLHLRTGLEAKYISQHIFAQYDFYATSVFYNKVRPGTPASFTLDFYLSGEIQRTAMVYFSWENLFNNFYYVTPYFPMPTRGIRFGITWEFAN